LFFFVTGFLFVTGFAAQTERGVVEITGFSGAMFSKLGPSAQAFNFTNNTSSFSHPGTVHSLFGGEVAVSLLEWLWLYGDSSYIGLGHVTATAGNNSATARSSLFSFHGARFQFLGQSRINPYVTLAAGQFRSRGSASATCAVNGLRRNVAGAVAELTGGEYEPLRANGPLTHKWTRSQATISTDTCSAFNPRAPNQALIRSAPHCVILNAPAS